MNLSKKLLASILLLLNFALLHYVLSSIPIRFDLTKDDIYTVSDSTKALLAKLEQPVQLDFYVNKSLKDLPLPFTSFGTRVEQMLRQYERASGGMIKLRVIDPQPDSPEEEMATSAGLHGQEWSDGSMIYLGLVATQGDVEKNVPFFDWNKEDFLEYDLSRLIYETQQFTKTRLGLLTSLPLQAPPFGGMPGQPPPQDQYFVEQLAPAFDIMAIEPTDTDLPIDMDMLAIVHPQNLSEELLFAIDQFALAGKPIFLAVDPLSIVTAQQSQQRGMMMPGGQDNSSDLPGLLAAWGLQYDASKAVVDPGTALAQGPNIRPIFSVLDAESTNQELMPASGLEGVITIASGALTRLPDATTQWQPVFSLSPEAGTVEAMMLQFSDGPTLLKQNVPSAEPVFLAGLLTGQAKTAFPDKQAATEGSLAEGNITAFVISDTDWLMDQFSIQRVNFLGMNAIQPQNDNQKLAANFMEFLGGSQDLIGIRAKRRSRPEFDVVKEMEADAQKAYQAKLQQVEDQLAAVTAKISQLIGDQRGGGFIVATPEIQQALDEQKDQQAALRAERRDIRRGLRQGIESLGHKVGALNLLWAPIGLVAFYIVFNRMRKLG